MLPLVIIVYMLPLVIIVYMLPLVIIVLYILLCYHWLYLFYIYCYAAIGYNCFLYIVKLAFLFLICFMHFVSILVFET
jgi:hypothetical protein